MILSSIEKHARSAKIGGNKTKPDKTTQRPGVGASGQDHHTRRWRRGQKSRRAMREREGRQGGIWHLDVVDGRISNGRWESGSHGGVFKRRRLDGLPQLPWHGTNGGVRRWTMGNRNRTPKVRYESGSAASTRSHDSGGFQWFAGSHQADGAPGPRARAAASESNQRAC